MRVLVDTCVIIDALQSRAPFSEAAQKLFIYSANKQFEGYITAKSVTDIYYLTHRLTLTVYKLFIIPNCFKCIKNSYKF